MKICKELLVLQHARLGILSMAIDALVRHKDGTKNV